MATKLFFLFNAEFVIGCKLMTIQMVFFVLIDKRLKTPIKVDFKLNIFELSCVISDTLQFVFVTNILF